MQLDGLRRSAEQKGVRLRRRPLQRPSLGAVEWWSEGS